MAYDGVDAIQIFVAEESTTDTTDQQPKGNTTMSYLITHFWEGVGQEQYDAMIAEVHPADGSLPEGQLHHFAGPTEGGFLVVALWENKEQNDAFQQQLLPLIGAMENPPPPPEERTAEVTNQVSA